MEHIKDNRVNVDALKVRCIYIGQGRFRFDGIVQQENAEYHLFCNEGSIEHSPFIQLLSDFAFEEMPTGNQEIVRVHAQKMESPRSVWFFCWDFKHVESESAAPFVDHDVSLELRQSDRFIRTNPVESDNGTGNAVCLARWDVSPSKVDAESVLIEVNHLFHVPLMEGMPVFVNT